jgi:hypothetical protein
MDTNNNNEHLILVTIVTRCRNEEGIEVTDGGRTGGKTRKRGDGGVWAKLAFLPWAFCKIVWIVPVPLSSTTKVYTQHPPGFFSVSACFELCKRLYTRNNDYPYNLYWLYDTFGVMINPNLEGFFTIL